MYRHIVTPAARALAARAGGVTATRLEAAFGIHHLNNRNSIHQVARVQIADSCDRLPPASPTACDFRKLRQAVHTSADRSKPNAREESTMVVFTGLRGEFALYLCSAAPRDTTLEDAALCSPLHLDFRSAFAV